jgi:hypothetical protein
MVVTLSLWSPQAFDIDAVARDAMRTRHTAVELGKLLSASA